MVHSIVNEIFAIMNERRGVNEISLRNFCVLCVAVDCIALNYWGKHKRKMLIRGIN